MAPSVGVVDLQPLQASYRFQGFVRDAHVKEQFSLVIVLKAQ